ncbi:hypothetical protein Tco_0126269, partial [Tanacetum coccineum]
KASSSKHKQSQSSGSYSSYNTSSSKAKPTATPGLADEVIHSFLATNADDIATKKTHSPRQPSSTPISKSADDIMTFRKDLDALLAQRIAEEEKLTEQQKKRKAQVQFEAQHYTNEDWDFNLTESICYLTTIL